MTKSMKPILCGAILAVLAFAPLAASEAQPVASEAEVAGESAEQTDSPVIDERRTFADWWAMGGVVMYPIAACSVLALALTLERVWSLRRSQVIPRSFLEKLRHHSQHSEFDRVIDLCAAGDHAIARVLRAGLIHFDQGLSRMEGAVESAGAHEGTSLKRNLSLLGAIGNMATMFGLLGTVMGMIQSFDRIAKTGTGDARVVAGGIFEAMITTAAGLMVGLFAVACHSYLRRKVEILELELEEKSFRMLEDLWLGRGESRVGEGSSRGAA